MKKSKKNIIFFLFFASMPLKNHPNTLQQNAVAIVGAAMAIGGVHLLVKRVGTLSRKRETYIQDSAENPLLRTRKRSFTRSSLCNQGNTPPDFYQESKKILTRILGIAGIAAGMYLILNGTEVLEKMNRAQRAYTWMGHWKNFKDYVVSYFAPTQSSSVVQ